MAGLGAVHYFAGHAAELYSDVGDGSWSAVVASTHDGETITESELVLPGQTPRVTIQTATRQGDGRTNQDTVIVSSRAAAVLDGATTWYPQDPSRDGGWYSRTLAAQVLPTLDGGDSLQDLLAAAIKDVAETYGLRRGSSSPESTVSIARWDQDSLELLVLGDSPVVVFGPEPDPIVGLDDRLEAPGAAARAVYHAHLRSGGGYGQKLTKLLKQLQHDEIQVRNREGGYWTAETDPAAAHRALHRSWPIEDVSALLLLTDGASAGVLDYGRPGTWAEALSAVIARGPGSFIDGVYAAEDSDPDGWHWPRSKCHDDKADVLVNFHR